MLDICMFISFNFVASLTLVVEHNFSMGNEQSLQLIVWLDNVNIMSLLGSKAKLWSNYLLTPGL